MKKQLLIISLCLSFLTTLAYGKTKTAPAPTVVQGTPSEQINYVIKRAGNLNMGVMIKNLSTGQYLYQHNSRLPFIPASNLKVFTAVAALEYLTPGFQYQTTLAAVTPIVKEGVLQGDLFLTFRGDPSLTRQDINSLFTELKQHGVYRITGNLYINDLYFDHQGKVPDALMEDATYCFSAPVASDMIDHNCVGVRAAPSPRLGAPAVVNFIQAANSAILINQIKTGRGRGCNIMVTMQDNNAYLLNGCILYKSRAQEFSVPVQNLRLYAAGVAQQAMDRAHIRLDGKILFASPRVPLHLMAVHQSKPLAVLVRHMLKESDNLYANALVKTLGASYFKTAGSWQNGTAAVRAILTQNNGVNFAGAHLVDGAGLSTENVITAEQMLQVLSTVYAKPAIYAALWPALPIGGVDGTLKGRMSEKAYRGRVHAKTGTMSEVSSLSGYLQTQKRQTLAFAILINDSSPHAGKYRNIEDTICKILILSY